MKRTTQFISLILAVILLISMAAGCLDAAALSAGDEVKGNTVCQVLGMDGGAYMNWLESHENDSYYLGTPYLPYDHRNPNGDCKNEYGYLDEAGVPGMNCMGFVWHVLYKATSFSGGDLDRVDAEADGRMSFYNGFNITRKYFRNKKEMLKSGYLEKGDIIWMIPDQEEYSDTVYHHTGIYWGDGHSDLMWHSNTETGGQGECNVISKIYPMLDRNTMYIVLKVGAKKLADPVLKGAFNTENGIRIRWDAVEGASKYRVFINKAGKWRKLADTRNTAFTYTGAVYGEKCTFTVRCITDCGKGYTSMHHTGGVSCTRCPAPKLSFSNTPTGIKISWNKVTGAASYRVYLKTGEGYSVIADTEDTTAFYGRAQSGKAYTFTVRSVPADGSRGAYHADGYATTYFAPPRVIYIGESKDGVRLCWTHPQKAVRRFRIFRRVGSSWKVLGDTPYTVFTDKTADGSKGYIYAVRGISADGRRFLTGYRPTIVMFGSSGEAE